MADSDFYSLLMDSDEPNAQQRAQALASVLRKEQTAGQLMQLHPLMKQMGAGLAQSAGQQQGRLAEVGQFRAGGVLKQALAQKQLEAQQARDEAQRKTQATRDAEQRQFQAGQNALGRKATLDAAGVRAEREEERNERADGKADKAGVVSMRKEFQMLPEVKGLKEVESSYKSLQTTAKDLTGPGGIATIFNVMKILDPGVAVMEGDVNLIRNSGGRAAAFANIYEQAMSGNPLPPEVRTSLLRVAENVYRARKESASGAAQNYRSLAEAAGLDPSQVVVGFDLEEPQAAPAPKKSGQAIDLDAPTKPAGGLSPDKQKRLDDLRRKKAAGELR